MSTLSVLYRFRWRSIANQSAQQMDNNKLKFIIVSVSAIVLWASIFIFFHNSLHFVHTFQEIGDVVRLYFLALFFFALGVMLILSLPFAGIGLSYLPADFIGKNILL